MWVVNILPDGIGSTVNLIGLYVLALYYHDHKLTIHEIKTGKRLLEWDGDKIRRAGCIKSLSFVEAGAMCHGGPGLIWIQYCHCRQLYEYLDRLVNYVYRLVEMDNTTIFHPLKYDDCCKHHSMHVSI